MFRSLFLLLLASLLAAPAFARPVEFAQSAPAEGTLIIPLAKADEIDTRAAMLDPTERARLKRMLEQDEFTFDAQSTATLDIAGPYRKLIVVGLGAEPLDGFGWQEIGGTAVQAAAGSKGSVALIATGIDGERAIANLALGARLGSYKFDKYLSAEKSGEAPLTIVTQAGEASAQFEQRERHLADAVAMTRDLINEPANVLYPESFVKRVRGRFEGVAGVTIDVLDVAAMKKLKMGSILSVGQGSQRPPRMLIVRYRGTESAPRIAIAGKGITFDTGGTSLKPGNGMWAMKGDMAGAAAAVATVYSLAKSKAPVDVVAIAALAENMPGGTATRPGDVVTAMNGKTIEILNTDAEGRLVLADALVYAEKTYRPSAIVDIATLTGSVSGALSDVYAGLLTDNEMMASRLLAAGKSSGEELWRLPMHPRYGERMKSEIADVRNIAPGQGPGASLGGHFLREFVGDTPWAHLDIAGVDNASSSRPTVPAGYVGFGVRLLDRFVREFSEASQ